MKSRTKAIVGWVMTALLSAFLMAASAPGKLVDFEGKDEMFAHLGWTTDVMTKIGVVEIAIAVLILIPRTAFVGAILLTAYLGGATATHVRVGDPFYMPIVLGVVLWVAYGLRRPEIFKLAIGSSLADVAGLPSPKIGR